MTDLQRKLLELAERHGHDARLHCDPVKAAKGLIQVKIEECKDGILINAEWEDANNRNIWKVLGY